MKTAILKSLSIEQGEESKVFLLLLQSFFLGTFMATYETVSTALFQDYFEDSKVASSLIISGCVGIVFSFIYGQLQKRINFSSLAIIILFVVSAITFTLRFGFGFLPVEPLVFTIFLMLGPLNVVSILSFWGVVTRIFNLRQGKRLFGLVDTGLILGMILISFSIPFLQKALPSKEDILFVSAGSITLALIIQFIISSAYKKDINTKTEAAPEEEPKKVKNSVSWFQIMKDKYLSSLSLFVIFSMVGAFFIWYSWMAVAKDYFPSSEERLNYIGIFIAIVMVFTLLIKTFVFSKIMKTYGLKVSLLVLPLLLIAFTVIASLIGSAFGYTSAAGNFALFFLVVNLSRLFSQSIKLSIEAPAMKLLFQPLNASIRYDVQAKVDGVVNELAGIIAGSALILIAFLNLDLIYVTYSLIAILIVWAFVTSKTYKEYQSTLKKSLDSFKSADKEEEEAENNKDFTDLLVAEMNATNADKVIYALHLSQNLEPRLYESSIQTLLESDSEQVKIYALNKIASSKILEVKSLIPDLISREKSEAVKALAEKTLEILDNGYITGTAALDKLAKSKSSSEREHAAILLGTLPITDHNTNLLMDLIRDLEPNVRLAAINAGAKVNTPELYPFIIDNLANPKYSSAATSAVVSLGDYIIKALDSSFYKAGYNSTTLIRITKILGMIGGEEAQKYLVNKLTYPDKKVISQALISLKSSNYTSDEANKAKILQRIEDYIGYIGWNLAALDEIDTNYIGTELEKALEEETENNYNLLYLLLSLIYDPITIQNIRNNIETGTSESIGYAIELLDLFVDESLKPKLFPLIEDMPIAEKMREMEVFFPRNSLSSTEVLLDIINRDYTVTNRWTKAAAIHAYGKMPEVKVTQDLIANLFNPDALIRESAAKVIYTLDKKAFNQAVPRIDKNEKIRLERLVKTENKQNRQSQYEKIAFLKNIQGFTQMRGLTLAEITDYFETITYKEGASIYSRETSNKYPLQFIFRGKAALREGENEITSFSENDAIGEMLILDSDLESTQIIAQGEVVTFALRDESLYGLMYNHKEIAEAIITILNERVMLQKV